ncbi:hypothetical protein Ddye_027096 [Dipteronia dyeriana]|uniref:Wall-associated receptor kinase galacturonan-binding domain-containing protein n=1 Tax=Dipteronia dyeriana TaxID=168575 RepID=A0AAD9WQ56_9ROSI|nr:hypothetical protein Ddye_027096 [Dipteronia dyeriana]
MAFIKDRQIVDCFYIVEEVMNYWKKDGRGGLLVKLEFEKAYDSVDNDFLLEVLANMGFGSRWQDWVKWCIASPSLSILFADDTILCLEPKVEYLLNAKRILRCFEIISGLKINFHKSFLVRVGKKRPTKDDWASIFRCVMSSLPVTYLGLPLGGNSIEYGDIVWDGEVLRLALILLWASICSTLDMIKFPVALWFKHYDVGSDIDLTLLILGLRDRCVDFKLGKLTMCSGWKPLSDVDLSFFVDGFTMGNPGEAGGQVVLAIGWDGVVAECFVAAIVFSGVFCLSSLAVELSSFSGVFKLIVCFFLLIFWLGFFRGVVFVFGLGSCYAPVLFAFPCFRGFSARKLQQIQCSTSCGDIKNISYPFRLEGDPAGCGDPYFELSCQSNKTILEFLSGKYYVKNISYDDRIIRVVDVNLANGSCGLPQKSISTIKVLDYNDYRYIVTNEDINANFVRCSSKISDPTYRRLPCLNIGNQSYVYVSCDRYWEDGLPPVSCSFNSRVPIRKASADDNPSYETSQKLLRSGFDLKWSVACKDWGSAHRHTDCDWDQDKCIDFSTWKTR